MYFLKSRVTWKEENLEWRSHRKIYKCLTLSLQAIFQLQMFSQQLPTTTGVQHLQLLLTDYVCGYKSFKQSLVHVELVVICSAHTITYVIPLIQYNTFLLLV